MASRSLTDLHPLLVNAYEHSKDEFQRQYSNLPQPFLTSTYRSNAEQAALFAQGRQPLAEVNRLRGLAGIPSIAARENVRVTNARPGQSPHNSYRGRAFDIAFININRKLDWSQSLFQRFANIMLTHPDIVWGGHFHSIKDTPHFELQNWRDARWGS
jgi:peptidoglycan L-alanyl-D-glutamate endopeptidase CwlK